LDHKKAILLLAICATLWSFGGVLIKSVPLHPLAIAGIRSAISALVVAIAARRFHFIWTRAQIGAAVCFALTVLAFVAATKLTTAANAILLQYTAPVYVALLSGPLLSEKITRTDIKALIAVMLGMVIFFLEKISPESFLGNGIALASGFSFAGLALCLRMQNGESIFESIFLGHLLTAAVGIPFLAAGPQPSLKDSLLLLILGIFQLGIPYVLYGLAVRKVSALEASMIPVIEPILNPLWVALYTGEIPSVYSFIGGSLVIGAVLWHSFKKLKLNSAAFKNPAPID
jgi:drug/metabolite transporter (DMT)-like permease